MPDIRIESKIELRVELDHLTPLQGSLKELSVEAYQKLEKSILKYGFKFPIFIWRETKTVEARIMGGKPTTTVTNWILDGHGRRLFLLKKRSEGWTVPPLPCVEIEAPTLEEAKRYILLISSQYQHMTGDGLYEFMSDAGITVEELEEYDLPHIDMVEFRQEFFEDPEVENEGQCGEDEVPDKPAETRVCAGDVWTLGQHRLLCGDSSRVEDVQSLMKEELADMVFTDPPYGVSYDGGTTKREKLANDDGDDMYGVACEMGFTFSKDDAALYMWHAGTKSAQAAAAAAGWVIRSHIIWNKNMAQFGALSAQYKQKHEPAFYCYKQGQVVNWDGPTNEVTVWDCNRSSKNEFHPTQKPVELAERALRNHKAPIVLELFGGSGSTLIACEKVGRKCRAIELDPGYCAVILSRWAKFSGKDPVRESDGAKWSTINMV